MAASQSLNLAEDKMTLESFRRCVALKTLTDGEREWLPKWLGGDAKFHGVESAEIRLEMTEARVIAFLLR